MVVMAAVYAQWVSVSMGETARPYTEEAFAREAGVPAVSSDATRGGPPEQSNPFGPLKVDSPPDTPLNSGSQEPHYFPPTLYPTVTPTLAPPPTLVAQAVAYSGQLTEAEMRALLAEAGAPAEWIAPMLTIAWCESHYSPGAVGDSGNSLGVFQLWSGWFFAGEDPYDPLTNARVAVRVREIRGRFGSTGGWTCATNNGIE